MIDAATSALAIAAADAPALIADAAGA